MGLTSWSSSNYLTRSASMPVSAYPYFLSIWGTANANGAPNTAFAIGHTASIRHGYINVSGTNLRVTVYDGTTIVPVNSSGAYPQTGAWFHMGGRLLSTTNRSVILNGAASGADTTSCAPGTPTSMFIGCRLAATEPWFNTQGLAEASIWDGTGMTEANMASLNNKLYNGGAAGAGGNPLNITAESSQPWTAKLLAYWPLTNTSTLTDASGAGLTLTMTGTLTNHASHPTIEAVSGGGGGGTIAALMAAGHF